MDIGSRLKKLRMERGFTQKQLAEALFVSRQTVINWEQGRTSPDAQSLVMLSALTGVPIDSILKGDAGLLRRAADACLRLRHRIALLSALIGAAGAAASFAVVSSGVLSGVPLALMAAGIPLACCVAVGIWGAKSALRWNSDRLLLMSCRYPLETTLQFVVDGKGQTMRFENREGGGAFCVEEGLPVPRGSSWVIRDCDGSRISLIALHNIVVATPTPYIKARIEGFGSLKLEKHLELRGLYQNVWKLSGQDVEVEGDWLGDALEFRADGATFASVCVSGGFDARGVPIRSYRISARNAFAMPLAVTLTAMFALMQDIESLPNLENSPSDAS